MHLGTIYLEHRIGVGRRGYTPLLLHISYYRHLRLRIESKGMYRLLFHLSSYSWCAAFCLPSYPHPLLRICSLGSLQVLLVSCRGRCLCVSCVLCIGDFLLTFGMWLWVISLCKCELHFKVAAPVDGFSCLVVECVCLWTKELWDSSVFLAPSICLTGEVSFIRNKCVYLTSWSRALLEMLPVVRLFRKL
jgi:hypothetical protein